MTQRKEPTAPGFREDAAPLAPPRKPLAQRAYEERHPPKRAVNLTASSYWVHEAKALGLNLSEIFGAALEAAVRDARRAEYREQNAAFAEWYNREIEENGLWCDEIRTF